MDRENLYHILYKVIIVGLIFVSIGATGFFHKTAKEALPQGMTQLNTGWMLKMGEKVQPVEALPKTIFEAPAGTKLFCQLPSNLKHDSILAFPNAYQDVDVNVRGVHRYTYCGYLPYSKRRMNTNGLCVVPLQMEDSGKIIEISFQSPVKEAQLYLPAFYIGTEALMILESFRSNVLTLGITGIMIFFALLLLAMGIREWMERGKNGRILLHTSVFMLLSSIWSAANSQVLYLGSQREMLLGYLSFQSFMLLPVILPIFYGDVLEEQGWFLHKLSGVAAANFILQNILHLMGKFQYIQMMPITYMVLLFTLFALAGISIREYAKRKSFYTAGFFMATIAFLGFYFLDVLRFFYFMPLDNAKFFRYGVLACIVVTVWIFAKRIRCYVAVEVENRVYKELALRDVLTHLPNRAALEKRIEALEESGALCPTLTVILMDVNGLKPVNDTEGHGAGDQLLCEAAKSIQEAFPEEKDAWYRLGGDEFVVLLTKTVLSNEACQQRIAKTTEKWGDFQHGPISISCGSKTVENVMVTKEMVQNLMHEADQIMYENKLQYYQKKLNKIPTGEVV